MLTTLSGQPVSRFSFGTMQFGGNADAAESAALYETSRNAGINFFDTAHGYAVGESECLLGRFVSPERDDVFLATKAAGKKNATPDVIHSEFAESRKRLGVDVVDLLYVHQVDPLTPLEETLTAFRDLLETGAIRFVGLSNHSAWQVMKARRIAQDMGFDITVLQPMYNLVKRQVEVEILPMAQSESFLVCPYSPLGGGLLTGKYAHGETGRIQSDDMYAKRYGPAWMHEVAKRLAAIGTELGVHPATLAVAWAARHPGVWGPILSARSVEQFGPSLAGIQFEMDDALYERVSSLSPKPAPANDRLEEI